MFCNTKIIAIFIVVLPFFALADGNCTLIQQPNGNYEIVCSGSGLEITTETVIITNAVSFADCEAIKTALTNGLETIGKNSYDAYDSLIDLRSRVEDYWYDGYITDGSSMGDIYYTLSANIDKVRVVRDTVGYPYPYGSTSLLWDAKNINCYSCSTNSSSGGGGDSSCCVPDFSEILGSLTLISSQISEITNSVHDYTVYFESITNNLIQFRSEVNANLITNNLYWSKLLNLSNSFPSFGNEVSAYYGFSYPTITKPTVQNPMFTAVNLGQMAHYPQDYGYFNSLLADVLFINRNLSSLNNWFYYNSINYESQNVTNLLHLYQHTTNFFTFFRREITPVPPLSNWSADFSKGSYYDYLTNNYLRLNRGEPTDLESTNWFGRIEALLAALVFGDDGSNGTNTVDSSYMSAEQQSVDEMSTTISGSASRQFTLVSSTGEGIISLLRRFSSSFSVATRPSTVVLLTVPALDGTQNIEFSTEEHSAFFDICRNVTTLIWVFLGLFLLYKYITWALRKIYSIMLLVYDFIQSIFGK